MWQESVASYIERVMWQDSVVSQKIDVTRFCSFSGTVICLESVVSQ